MRTARAIAICSRCNRENDRPSQRYCSGCHAEYMREWRKAHPLNDAAKARDIARSYVGVYLKRGKLSKEPCCICGDKQSEMHHPDHELPLEVVWLCRKCHLAWHSFFRQVAADTWAFWLRKVRLETFDARETIRKARRTA